MVLYFITYIINCSLAAFTIASISKVVISDFNVFNLYLGGVDPPADDMF